MLSNRLQQHISQAEVGEKTIQTLIENPFSLMREFLFRIERTICGLCLETPTSPSQLCLPLSKWCPDLSHPGVELVESMAIRTLPSSSVPQLICAMSLRGLDPLPASLYRWTLKFHQITDRVSASTWLATSFGSSMTALVGSLR